MGVRVAEEGFVDCSEMLGHVLQEEYRPAWFELTKHQSPHDRISVVFLRCKHLQAVPKIMWSRQQQSGSRTDWPGAGAGLVSIRADRSRIDVC